MAANVYEGMFILDSRDSGEAATAIPEMIRQIGGEVLVNRLWEERRLAYPIRGQRKGTYWLSYFRLDPSKLGELTRKSQLNENILRFLFLKVDPRIVDTLVAHATSSQAARPSEGGDQRKSEDGQDGEERQESRRQKAGAGSRVRQAVEALDDFEE